MALLDEAAGDIAVLTYECVGRQISRASAPSIRRRCGWSAPSARCSAWRRSARPTRGPGSISASGTWRIRSATRRRAQKPEPYRVPPGRRRGAAPDPGRAGACRHHRARPFPLHRQWRVHGAAGAAARLCAQGHRVADGGRVARQGRQARRAHLGRQHGRLFFCLRAGRGGRVAGDRAGTRDLSARADGGAGAARQPPRRHRRHLQRCRLRADACANGRAARARLARGAGLLRPPADDGRDRARRRRPRHRAGGAGRDQGLAGRGAAPVSRAWSSSTTIPPRCRTAPSSTGIVKPEYVAPVRRRRLRRARFGPRTSTRGACRATRLTTN